MRIRRRKLKSTQAEVKTIVDRIESEEVRAEATNKMITIDTKSISK